MAVFFLFIAASPAPAQFVAFNDHAPGLGTHSNATTYSSLVVPSGGPLTNITSGLETPVSLTNTSTGSGLYQGGAAAGYPAVGTPAYLTFTNFVDFVGSPSASVHISNVVVHYTFSGLNVSNRYSFKGSAVRGGNGANYSNRWTKVSLLGAVAYTSQHTAKVVTTATQPTLADNEAVVNFGVNLTGDMVWWDDIEPAPDGTFEITCEFYRGPLPAPYSATNNNPHYGYAITAIRLEEKTLEPVAITSGPDPASTNILQGETARFEVTATGTAPTYRWSRADGEPIVRALSLNSPVLTITNAQPSDSATYRVEVTNTMSSVISTDAVLVVEADTTPPTILSALGLADGTNIVLSFSEALDSAMILDPSAFHVHLTEGGGDLTVTAAVVANSTNVVIWTDALRPSNMNYTVSIATNAVADANGVSFAGAEIPLPVQVVLISFNGTRWKYNDQGVDLGLNFYLPDTQYDDSLWPTNLSVFDAKNPSPPGRTNVAGFAVATQLALTNSLYPVTNGVIPTYYFRTHFNLPTTPDHVTSLKLRTLVDDFDAFFINTNEAYRSSGYPATNPPPRFGYAGGTAVSTASILGPFDIATNLLVKGDNLAAVILNQVSPTSSDITFAYQLIAVIDQFPEPAVPLSIALDPNVPGNVIITWPTTTSGQLHGRTQLDSGEWIPIDTSATPGQYSFNPQQTEFQVFTLRR